MTAVFPIPCRNERTTSRRNPTNLKGILLAGGSGSRLRPVTQAISKQLLPVYDKPMIYYPLSALMLNGIDDILIIVNPKDLEIYKNLLGDGSQWGIKFTYKIQSEPNGLAQAFCIGEDFINGENVTLILGDNIFWGHGLSNLLDNAKKKNNGAHIFGYYVNDPERYGVVEFDENQKVVSIEEKPKVPKSNYAIVGLYHYDSNVVEYAKQLQPSARGEYEITDLNKVYLEKGALDTTLLKRGMAWLDTGTHETMLQASQFVEVIQSRQGLQVACPEEIAYLKGWIDKQQVTKLGESMKSNNYGKYLINL